jgi:hypothetical protein
VHVFHEFKLTLSHSDAAEIFAELRNRMPKDPGIDDVQAVAKQIEDSQPPELAMTMLHGARTMTGLANGKKDSEVLQEQTEHAEPVSTMRQFFDEMGSLWNEIINIKNVDVTEYLTNLIVTDEVTVKEDEAPILVKNQETQ